MSKFIDVTGMKFSKLTVLKRADNDKHGITQWKCQCECGNYKIVGSSALRRGAVKSCGCFSSVWKSKCNTTHGGSRRGSDNTSEYDAWSAIIQRCTNPRSKPYPFYGGRGIKICDRWRNSFENFISDMGPKPSPAHSIDRYPNNDGDYEPNNCRWATQIEQTRNFRRNRWIEHDGERLILQDWANRFGVSARDLSGQLNKMPLEEAVSYLLNPNRRRGRGSGSQREIGCFSKGVLIKKYSRIKDASEDNFNINTLYHALSKKFKYKGLEWKYLDDKKAA